MNLALFDFDGTITLSDSFTPFIFQTVARRRLAVGRVLLAPLIAAYKLRLLPATVLRQAIVAVGYRGRDAAAIRAAGARYAAENLPKILRAQALERLAWHRREGDRVVIVSASLECYLEPWCKAQGFELICVRLGERRGILTGRYAGGDCSAGAKARRVRERYNLADYPTIYAYGDTAEDRELLALAHRAFYHWNEVDPNSKAITMAKRIR